MSLFSRQSQSAQQAVVNTVQSAVLADDDPVNIASAAREALALVNRYSDVLPMEGIINALAVVDMVNGCISLGIDNLNARISLSAVVRDYLPTSVKTYIAAKRSGHDDPKSLVDQMVSLSKAVAEVQESIQSHNVSALETQAIFLRTKFSGSDLL